MDGTMLRATAAKIKGIEKGIMLQTSGELVD
jgi:hypothetical protein